MRWNAAPGRRFLGILCCTLSLAALNRCDKKVKPDQTQSPVPTAIELDSGSNGWTEISAGVVQNAGGGTAEKLLVFGSGKGLTRPLQAPGSGPFDSTLPSAGAEAGHWSNDQLNVQLANGDILLTWNGFTRAFDEQFSKTVWWNTWPTADGKKPDVSAYGVDRNGVRPAQLIWRYSAKDDQWLPGLNALDAALVGAVDNQGKVQRSWCAQGVPWAGGFDRPEIYADPWGVDKNDPSKQRLIVSVRCMTPSDDSQQIFVSNDSGATWQDSGIRLGPLMAPVTATSSGRVFIVQGTKLFVSVDGGKTLAPWSVNGFDIATQGYAFAALQGSETGVGAANIAPTLIGAVGPSTVLAVYPSVETATVKGVSIQRQVYVPVLVLVPLKDDPTPMILPLDIVRAHNPGGSVILASLITDDRPVGNPLNMLYWVETIDKPANPGVDSAVLLARYMMFGGPGQFSGAPKDLGSNAFLTNNINSYANGGGLGDYMKGAFYYDKALKTLNFVPVWPQQKLDGTMKPFARVITMAEGSSSPPASGGTPAPPAPASAPAPAPCDTCEKPIQ